MAEPSGPQQKRILRVRTSGDSESHTVTVTRDEKALAVTCSCPAGALSPSCYHKLGVLLNDASILIDIADHGTLEKIQTWVKQTGFRETWTQLKEAEQRLVEADRQVKALQTQLETLLTEGIPRQHP